MAGPSQSLSARGNRAAMLFPLFLAFAFSVWRFAVHFIPSYANRAPTRKKKYFVLRGSRRGEILESSGDFQADSSRSDTIALHGHGPTSVDVSLSEIQLISDEVADVLLAITPPAERFAVLDDSGCLVPSLAGIRNGRRVTVKVDPNGAEIPGVVTDRGLVNRALGTLFAVRLQVSWSWLLREGRIESPGE